MIPTFTTTLGQCFEARAEEVLGSDVGAAYAGRVDLVYIPNLVGSL